MHCDLAPAQGLWQQRDDYTCLLGSCQDLRYEDRALAELVNPLVITETGTLKPIAYDLEGQFDLTSIDDPPSDRLRDYKRHRLPRLQSLVGGALVALQDRNGLVDWFDHCALLSGAFGRHASRPASPPIGPMRTSA